MATDIKKINDIYLKSKLQYIIREFKREKYKAIYIKNAKQLLTIKKIDKIFNIMFDKEILHDFYKYKNKLYLLCSDNTSINIWLLNDFSYIKIKKTFKLSSELFLKIHCSNFIIIDVILKKAVVIPILELDKYLSTDIRDYNNLFVKYEFKNIIMPVVICEEINEHYEHLVNSSGDSIHCHVSDKVYIYPIKGKSKIGKMIQSTNIIMANRCNFYLSFYKAKK